MPENTNDKGTFWRKAGWSMDDDLRGSTEPAGEPTALSIDNPVLLRRLITSLLLIESDLSLPSLLARIVDEARLMAGARYAALGVLDRAGTGLSQFITSGMSDDVREAIGPPPTGHGVLGFLISHPKPLRLPDIRRHSESIGFPANHPPMSSFLGVPVKVRDEIYGNLYLSEKIGADEFTDDDEAVVGALAVGAGVAIENANLHARVRQVALVEDRERIARDLHDAVIQRLFAVGLSLQGIRRVGLPGDITERLQTAVANIDAVIYQVRSTIFELGVESARVSTRSDILAIVHELRPALGFTVQVRFDGAVDSLIEGALREDACAVVREGLTNILKHSHADSARVTITASTNICSVEIFDNGTFPDGDEEGLSDGNVGGLVAVPHLHLVPSGGVTESSGHPSGEGHLNRESRNLRLASDGEHDTPIETVKTDGGLGLGNLRARAEKRGGIMTIESNPTDGTRLLWRVPMAI